MVVVLADRRGGAVRGPFAPQLGHVHQPAPRAAAARLAAHRARHRRHAHFTPHPALTPPSPLTHPVTWNHNAAFFYSAGVNDSFFSFSFTALVAVKSFELESTATLLLYILFLFCRFRCFFFFVSFICRFISKTCLNTVLKFI